jgi:hypothetical protein
VFSVSLKSYDAGVNVGPFRMCRETIIFLFLGLLGRRRHCNKYAIDQKSGEKATIVNVIAIYFIEGPDSDRW